MGKIFHISRIFWVKLSILALAFYTPVPFTPTTEYWHLVIWRDFVWLFGEVLFGYLARFRALSDDALSLLQILIEMKTTTVALGSHFDEFIQASVLGGRYTNASEVIRAGLRRLEEDEQKIAALRAAIEEGEASGYVEDFDFESHLEELKAKRRSND